MKNHDAAKVDSSIDSTSSTQHCISKNDRAAMEIVTNQELRKNARDWALTTTFHSASGPIETERLAGYSILSFSLFAKSQEKLPEIQEVSLIHDASSKKLILPKIIPYSPVVVSDNYGLIEETLGRYRREYFFFVPTVSISGPSGAVQLKLVNPRVTVRGLALPLKELKNHAAGEEPIESGSPPDPDTVARILNEEFCFARPRMLPQM